MLLDLCDIESKVAAAREPLKVDLTGGLGEIDLDMAELAAKAREEMAAEAAADDDGRATATIPALPSPPRGYTAAPPPAWDDLDVDPGRPGGDRRRCRARPVRLVAHPLRDGGRQRAVRGRCARAGLDHRAWSSGRTTRQPGWYDTETGELVDEAELVERYHDAVVERVGIREFVDDGAIDPDHASPLLVSVFLDKDFTFVVSVGGRCPGVRASSIPSTR